MGLRQQLAGFVQGHRSPCCGKRIRVRKPLPWFIQHRQAVEAWGLFCRRCGCQFAVYQELPAGVPAPVGDQVQYGPGGLDPMETNGCPGG